MKRKKSVKTLLISIFCILLTVTVLCFTVCSGYTLYTSGQELMRYNQAALDIHLNNLIHSMEDLQKFNEDIFASSLEFLALSQEDISITTAQRMQFELNLRRMIQNRTGEISGITLFSANQEESYYYFGEDFLGGQVNSQTIKKMKDIRALWTSQDAPPLQCWVSYSDGESTLLMNTFKRKNLYICAMVDVGAYARNYSDETQLSAIEFAFVTREHILTNTASAEKRGVLLEDMLAAAEKPVFDGRANILQTRFDEIAGVGICGMISLSGIWAHLRVYVLMLAASLLVICLLFIGMYQMLKRMLVYPLDQITDATRQIEKGAVSIHNQPEPIREFAEIQTALERLVAQKISLAQDNIDQTYQKEHALLQYYQLQTRSHFVLNCLKSIYSLTMKGDQEKTMRIIGLFSNHLRYIYHDSLSWVTIQAELDEVQDYFGIIEQGRSNHILLNQNVDPELLEFQVPPLIIQTFLENFTKHNAQDSRILRFCIRIDKVNLEGREYVRIRMTDNGVGYSEEALRGLENVDGVFEQHHVGVQNLCRRMDILYRKQYKKAFLNNPGGGALSIFYLPVALEDAQEEK